MEQVSNEVFCQKYHYGRFYFNFSYLALRSANLHVTSELRDTKMLYLKAWVFCFTANNQF